MSRTVMAVAAIFVLASCSSGSGSETTPTNVPPTESQRDTATSTDHVQTIVVPKAGEYSYKK